ncbi:Carbohydrate sulfotransferase 15 [Branchiostoma belcheri]|nr:Carbohydrate sulfotransferase 15 [Branchiostoma belcheri]
MSANTPDSSPRLCLKPRPRLFSGHRPALVAFLTLALLCVYGWKWSVGQRWAVETHDTSASSLNTSNSGEKTRGTTDNRHMVRLEPEIFAEIPRETLPDFKNPCWYEKVPETKLDSNPYKTRKYCNSGGKTMKTLNGLSKHFRDRLKHNETGHFRLRCLPYFYIIGMPKCGTSDLYYRLTQHPDVVGGLKKEPHYWTRKCFYNQMTGVLPNVTVPVRDYLDLFDGAAWSIQSRVTKRLTSGQEVVNHDVITGEASVSTLYDNRRWGRESWDVSTNEPAVLVVNLLRAVQPHAKFILTIRDPAERLYSEYLYFTHDKKSAAKFHEDVIIAVDIFNACLKNDSVRSCTYQPNLVKTRSVRLQLGLYEVYLRDWFSVFPPDQILVQRLEDHSKDPRATMTRVFEFLQLGPVKGKSQKAIFSLKKGHARKSKDVRLGPMLPKTRQILDEFYRPHNRRLAALLNDTRFLWLKDGSV